MNRLFVLLATGLGVLACTSAASRDGTPSPSPSVERAPPDSSDERVVDLAPPADGKVAVLVELFTSEGCSSCPPADVVLAALDREQPIAGVRIVTLGLHVDYWDRLGWVDPFSSPHATERQRDYRPLGGGAYTPQAVVDGRDETVGSGRAGVEKLIAAGAARAHASISLDLVVRPESAGSVEVVARVGPLPAGAASDGELVVALTQNRARIAVSAGENAGSTLENTAIVREIMVAGPAPVDGGPVPATLTVPAGVSKSDLAVVAFVQERASRRILGTATRAAFVAP